MELSTKEWAKFTNNESSHAHDINKRIPDRVGYTNEPDVHSRVLDGQGQIESYELPGAEDCFVCSSALDTTAETLVCVTSAGQYNGCRPPIEGRGHTVKSLHYLAAEILILANQHKIVLRPSYLLGLMNTQVDALSRLKEPDEWMLAPIVARRIFSTYSLPTIDLFFSERSKQLPRYFSTNRRDPHALGISCFMPSLPLA